MRFSLRQMLVFVTGLCLLCGLGLSIPLAFVWAIAVMLMWAGCLSAVSLGGPVSTRWWRATLNTWLGLLLIAGIVFQSAASLMVVEVLWVTGLSALLIGTGVITASRRREMHRRLTP